MTFFVCLFVFCLFVFVVVWGGCFVVVLFVVVVVVVVLRAVEVTRGWNGHRIRVSTQS